MKGQDLKRILLLLVIILILLEVSACQNISDIEKSDEYYRYERHTNDLGSLTYYKYYYTDEKLNYYVDNERYPIVTEKNIEVVKDIVLSFEEEIETQGKDLDLNLNYDFNVYEDLKMGDAFSIMLIPKDIGLVSVIPDDQVYTCVEMVYVSFDKRTVYRFEKRSGFHALSGLHTLKKFDEIDQFYNFVYDVKSIQNKNVKTIINEGIGEFVTDENACNYFYELQSDADLLIDEIYFYKSGIDLFYFNYEKSSRFSCAIGFRKSLFENEKDCFEYYSELYSNYDISYGLLSDGITYMEVHVHNLTYYIMLKENDLVVVLKNNYQSDFDYSPCEIKKIELKQDSMTLQSDVL